MSELPPAAPRKWSRTHDSHVLGDPACDRCKRRHLSERYLLERIARGDELDALLQDLMALIEQELPGGVASLLHVDANGRLYPHPGSRLPAPYCAAIEGTPIGPCAGSAGTAAFRREPVHVADIANDPLWAEYRQLAMAHGLYACWSDPVLDADGAVLATIDVYFDRPRTPAAEQSETLAGYAHLASIALQRDRRTNRERALQSRLHHTLDHLSEGFFILDRELRFIFINREALRLMQRPPEDLLGSGVFEVFPEARGSEYEHAYRQALDTDLAVEFEVFAPPSQTWFEFRVYPTNEGLAIYFRDIVERKRTEAAMRLQASALQAAANAIVITDRHGKIEWANAAFYQMTGYSEGDAVGRRPADLFKSGVQDEAFYRSLWDTIAGGETWRGRIVNRYRDGSLHTEEMTITPVRDVHGEVAHFIAVKQDISERLELEQALARAQRLESIGQLTGGVAHDFNNLLTVILGNAGVLSEQLPEDSPLHSLADMMVSAAERGAELTHQLLAFARKQTLAPSATNITALLDGMASMLRRSLDEQIDIRIRHAAGLPNALIDPAQFENAVLNLCLNARDAMPEGGRLMIETSQVELDEGYAAQHAEVRPGHYVLVVVSDSGCGIEAHHLGRVFEPFFTTKGPGHGTGLGLAMVYGFVKQSGGHATVHSEPGRGTTVRLFLPQDHGASGTASSGRGGQAADDAAVRGGSERILLVEDDPLVRDFASSRLTSLGYAVLSASNGPDAMKILRQRDDIALLFTDVIMPGGMNGPQLAAAARRLHPGLPVLLTSGYTEKALAHNENLDPTMRLLGKPYRHVELARYIRETLDAATIAAK